MFFSFLCDVQERRSQNLRFLNTKTAGVTSANSPIYKDCYMFFPFPLYHIEILVMSKSIYGKNYFYYCGLICKIKKISKVNISIEVILFNSHSRFGNTLVKNLLIDALSLWEETIQKYNNEKISRIIRKWRIVSLLIGSAKCARVFKVQFKD